VNDSSAWLRRSRTLDAATSDGIGFVYSGSSSPSVGFKRRLAMPVLAWSREKSKMLTPVVSLPVPAVVGIAMSGLRAPGTGSPLPIGGLTACRQADGGYG